MLSLLIHPTLRQRTWSLAVIGLAAAGLVAATGWQLLAAEPTDADATDKIVYELPKPGEPLVVKVPNATAETEAEMKPYTEVIPGTDENFGMVPIKGGVFLMGSPEDEEGRGDDEGPQVKVRVDPFWMGKHEVTWNEYDTWSFALDIGRRKVTGEEPNLLDKAMADAYTRPTKPYTDMTFGMGESRKGYPAICMTQLAARVYCEWLSLKTGRYYRLPTEAEWEYACRAGTTTPYSWGDDPEKVDEYAWYVYNSDFEYQKVGQKKPNPWGLHDMHGNVAEWVLDEYQEDFYKTLTGMDVVKNPLNPIEDRYQTYTHLVRGGSWDDEVEELRSANRRASNPDWKQQDPQIPQSDWYFTDALFVGFRVVRPLNPPENWREELKKRYEIDIKRPRDKQ